jgi:hypothetical protein
MTNVGTISNLTAVVVPPADASAGVSSMSPDALLAYCQMQLGSLDDEMATQIKAQDLALQQRTAVESVQTKLESFGTNGPQTYGELNECSAAFDAAIAKLGSSDPVARQLATQEQAMVTKYGSFQNNITSLSNPTDSSPLEKPPQNDDWKGTTDAVGTLTDDIKSGAEIQMLQLQDLVSQRQQAVEQATGMMTKEDQTLDDTAKAIGQ